MPTVSHGYRSILLLLILAGLLAAGAVAAAPGDENWDPVFALPGVDGEVMAALAFQGDLVIGGNFTAVGGLLATNLARYDGVQWSAMGDAFDGDVTTLVEWNGELYAGGGFTAAGATSIQGLARWDGGAWVEAAGGVDGSVQDLAVWDGRLAVAGDFTSVGGGAAFPQYVAVWDGTDWDPLGDGVYGYPIAIAAFAGDLYVCGEFDLAGSVSVANLARWDGTDWYDVGGGLTDEFGDPYNAYPASLAVQGSRLYVGGAFQRAGSVPVDGVVAWNGAAFSDLPGSSFGGDVYHVGTYGTDVVVNDGWGNLQRWNGFFWTQLGVTSGYVGATADYAGGLVVGGGFQVFGGVACNGLAFYDGAWSALADGEGANNDVEACLDWNGTLVVGGRFTRIGAVTSQLVAAWDGSGWTGLGDGIPYVFGGHVGALAAHGSDLVAGGSFTSAGGVPANKIARWDGAQWHAMGAGSNATVSGLLSLGGELYANGYWGSVQTVGRWDGSEFQPLGATGVAGNVQILYSLGSYQGAPVLGGSFTSVDGVPAANIARWDGAAWQALGGGVNGPVFAIHEAGGLLYVGGTFTDAGGTPVSNIAVWDGSSWSALGGGMNLRVHGITSFGGAIHATGQFTLADGQPAARIARWDGGAWSALGSGLNGTGRALAVVDGGLYVGGEFTQAGLGGSARLALWSPTASAVEPSPVGPTRLFLAPARPNPFQGNTTLAFSLQAPADVTIDVFDVRGARVRSVTRTGLGAGSHVFTWDGRDAAGAPAATGVYFVVVRDGDEAARRRVVLLR